MKKLIISFLLLTSSPLFALLSPLNQSIEELQKILESNELQDKLPSSQKIRSIMAIENGYLLTTKDYQMLVEIHYQQRQIPGPTKFKLIFHEPTHYGP